MSDATPTPRLIEEGGPKAAEELLPLVMDEALNKLAKEEVERLVEDRELYARAYGIRDTGGKLEKGPIQERSRAF